MSQVQEAFKTTLEINNKWCKGCGLCVSLCPRRVLSLDELGKVRINRQEECLSCSLCETTCPDFAIRVIKNA